jgi:hypothetical protein
LSTIPALQVEHLPPAQLKAHPRNYRHHPEAQIDHIVSSIEQHGFYRNIIVAQDGTVLTGHGVLQAARRLDLPSVPVVRLALEPDDPRAIKVLTGDNEIAPLAGIDDRLLSELLKEVMEDDPDGLEGTGYDEMMLANLEVASRPQSETEDFDEAAEWVGMPEYDEDAQDDAPVKISIQFRSPEDSERFTEEFGIDILKRKGKSWQTWWPYKGREDLPSLRFTG